MRYFESGAGTIVEYRHLVSCDWTVFYSNHNFYAFIVRYLKRITHVIQSCDDVNLKVAAGEVLALMYELGRDIDEDFVGEENGLCDLLKELATDGNKHKAKKDRRVQRASFRDILRAVEVFRFSTL